MVDGSGVTDSPPTTRRLFAEALGTAMLLATVVGSGIMAEALAGGNVAVAAAGFLGLSARAGESA